MLLAGLFGAASAFSTAFGDLALPMLCVGGATLAAILGTAILRSDGRVTAPLPMLDGALLVLLLPALSVVATIGTADAQLGGGGGRFAAGALAIAFTLALLRFGLMLFDIAEPGIRALATLPAVLVVSVIALGGDQLSADMMADGMRLALGVAGAATLLLGFTPRAMRRAVAVAVWVLTCGVALVFAGQSNVDTGGQTAAIEFLLALGAGALLLEADRRS